MTEKLVGVSIPAYLRGVSLQFSHPYDARRQTQKPMIGLRRKLHNELMRIDSLRFTAERTLIHFYLGYHQQQTELNQQSDWTLTREYHSPETSYLFTQDPSSFNTVMVTRVFFVQDDNSEVEGGSYFHWISPEVNPLTSLPFVYYLDVVVEDTDEYRATTVLCGSSIQSREEALRSADNWFRPTTGGSRRTKIEVWKQGSGERARSRASRKKRFFIKRPFLPKPAPQYI